MIRALLLVCATLAASCAEAQCRQALALGLDVSGSVDAEEYRLQLDGIAAALGDPQVLDALFAMPGTYVRVAVFEWSTPGDERILVPPTNLTGPDVLANVQARLRQTERTPRGDSTGLGEVMVYGTDLLAQHRDCWTQTLDISGDGKANVGRHPLDALAIGGTDITINALVIGSDDVSTGDARQVQVGELAAYFSANVIRGSDAFVETAISYRDYEAAMRRKLLRELAVLAVGQLPSD